MKEVIRPHPIFILSSLGKYSFLLLFPIFRILFHLLKSSYSFVNGFEFSFVFRQWLGGAWLDLVTICLFLSLGILLWHSFTVESLAKGLEIRRGIFRREDYFLPISQLSCITRVRPFFLRPLQGEYLRLDLPGGKRPSELVILLRERDVQTLLRGALSPVLLATPTPSYRPHSFYVLILAAISSNSFAGIVLMSTFITQLGNLLGEQFSEMIYGSFEEAARGLAFGLPPAAAALGYLFLFGYLCAFAVNVFRHGGFGVRRESHLLEIQAGLFTKRSYTLPVEKISCIDIRRTLLTFLFGVSSIFLHTVGYGKYKDDVSALIPCVRSSAVQQELAKLLPEYLFSQRESTPRLGSFFRYSALPLWCCGGVLVLGGIGLYFFPAWADLVGWMMLFCFVPAIWFLTVRVCDLATAGFSCKEDPQTKKRFYTLRYSQGFTLHRVILPQEKVSRISITQSLFQIKDGRCDLHLISYSEGKHTRPHHIRDLPRHIRYNLL